MAEYAVTDNKSIIPLSDDFSFLNWSHDFAIANPKWNCSNLHGAKRRLS